MQTQLNTNFGQYEYSLYLRYRLLEVELELLLARHGNNGSSKRHGGVNRHPAGGGANPSITSASVAPLMTGTSKESIFATLQANLSNNQELTTNNSYSGPTVESDGIQSVTVKVHVSRNTKYIKLSQAIVNNDPNTPNSTVVEGTTIGYLSNETDTSRITNPLQDSKIKRLANAPYASLPGQEGAAGTAGVVCTDPLGCDLYYILPIPPDATGVYSIIVTAYKGESQEKTTLTYFVDGTLPQTATSLLVNKLNPPYEGGQGVVGGPALLIGGSYYTNTQKVVMRGTATPGSYPTFASSNQSAVGRVARPKISNLPAGGMADYQTPSEHSTPIDLLVDYKVPDTGLYEVTLDLSAITGKCSQSVIPSAPNPSEGSQAQCPVQVLGAIKAVTKSPAGDILSTTNSHDGWSIDTSTN